MKTRIESVQHSHRLRFILASGSPRRRELLASLGVAFEIVKPDIDETQRPGEPPYEYVYRLSREKAAAVAAQVAAPAWVLAADTVVILAADTIGVLEGEVLGKPGDADEARAMLRRLRGRDHIVCTALTLLRLDEGERVTSCFPVVDDQQEDATASEEDPGIGAGGQ